MVNRLARIEGHVRAVKEMAANGRDCPDILLQIAAIQKALDSTAKLILKDRQPVWWMRSVTATSEACWKP